jgi:hypothetical protein
MVGLALRVLSSGVLQFVEEPFVVRSLKAAKPRGFLALQKAGPSLRSG